MYNNILRGAELTTLQILIRADLTSKMLPVYVRNLVFINFTTCIIARDRKQHFEATELR